MRKLLTEVPEYLYKSIKIYCIENNIYMRDFTITALTEYLKKLEGKDKDTDDLTITDLA